MQNRNPSFLSEQTDISCFTLNLWVKTTGIDRNILKDIKVSSDTLEVRRSGNGVVLGWIESYHGMTFMNWKSETQQGMENHE